MSLVCELAPRRMACEKIEVRIFGKKSMGTPVGETAWKLVGNGNLFRGLRATQESQSTLAPARRLPRYSPARAAIVSGRPKLMYSNPRSRISVGRSMFRESMTKGRAISF
jgi:hypothetical protein